MRNEQEITNLILDETEFWSIEELKEFTEKSPTITKGFTTLTLQSEEDNNDTVKESVTLSDHTTE